MLSSFKAREMHDFDDLEYVLNLNKVELIILTIWKGPNIDIKKKTVNAKNTISWIIIIYAYHSQSTT